VSSTLYSITLLLVTIGALAIRYTSISEMRQKAYIGSSPWWLRSTRRLSWKTKALLMVTHTTFIGSSPCG